MATSFEEGESTMPVTRAEFRDAMSWLGAAVNVITTAGAKGRGGFTASAVCSVTDTPPTLLVCMNRGSAQYDIFSGNGVLCVNTLGAQHQHLSGVFAGQPAMPLDERFGLSPWQALVTGAPVLEDAVVAFDCRIKDAVQKGTHCVFFAEVVAVRRGKERREGLIYFDRVYHPVGCGV
jgi:flavin reductase